MGRRGGRAGLGGSVVVCSVATALLLAGIAGMRHPVRELNSGAPPWPAPAAVGAGVSLAGMSLTTTPVVVTRFAVHLDVVAAGKPVVIPAGIGILSRARQAAPLFTSDDSGIVHVVSGDTDPRYTLGQFFDEWQVPLRDATAYVNGMRRDGDPAAVRLSPHQEILVSFGARPRAVPARYSFPAGV